MLIGITGSARSGKDTAADFYCDSFGFIKYSFALPLKEAIKVMFSLNEEHVNGDLKEVVLDDLGVSPRYLMQTLGTEWGRNTVNNDVWLLAAKRNLQNSPALDNLGVVIPDVRFENEADFIRENGGLLLHISRENKVQVLNHASENGVSIKPGEHCIENNGSIDDFYCQLAKIIPVNLGEA
jgi:hypothetical protein